MPNSKPLNWTAIGLGWALRTFGGGIVNAIVVAVSFPLVAANRTPARSPAQVALIIMGISFVVNAIFAVWSGYLAGRIAERDETRHAAILGAISFATALVTRSFALLHLSMLQIGAQLAFQGFLSLILVILTIWGGFLAQSKPKPPTSSQPFDPIPRV